MALKHISNWSLLTIIIRPEMESVKGEVRPTGRQSVLLDFSQPVDVAKGDAVCFEKTYPRGGADRSSDKTFNCQGHVLSVEQFATYYRVTIMPLGALWS